MRYFLLQEYGSFINLSLESGNLANPRENEIQIKHTYIDINRTDVLYRTGVYATSLPAIIGTTAIGYITAVGIKVEGHKIGDKVIYSTDQLGAYSESRNIDHNLIFPTNSLCSDHISVAYFNKIYNAFQLMRRNYMVLENDFILINGASGGLGHVMCQLASYHGANVIALVSSEENASFAKQNNAKHVIIGLDDLEQKVREITSGNGVKIAYDLIGGENAKILYNTLIRRGMAIHVGSVLGPSPNISVRELMESKEIYVTKINLNIFKKNKYEFLLTAEQVFSALDKNIIMPQEILEYNFQDIPTIHSNIESRKYLCSFVAKV